MSFHTYKMILKIKFDLRRFVVSLTLCVTE